MNEVPPDPLLGLPGFFGRLHDCSSLEAEVWALHKGLKEAVEKGVQNLEVEADSLLVVNYINGGPPPKSPLKYVLQDCMEFLARCRGTVKHTLREGNTVADKMANIGVEQGDPFVLLSLPPPEVEPLLAADLAGVSYIRV